MTSRLLFSEWVLAHFAKTLALGTRINWGDDPKRIFNLLCNAQHSKIGIASTDHLDPNRQFFGQSSRDDGAGDPQQISRKYGPHQFE